MKRLLAIWFVGLLCFSLFGYRLVIDFMTLRNEQQVSRQIDGGLNESELISLKVPVTLPYYTNDQQFEYVDGEVAVEGRIYRFVKRRIYNDSIEYRCLPNPGKTALLGARDQFFQLAYDLQMSDSKQGSQKQAIKPLMLEYCNLEFSCTIAPPAAAAENLPGYFPEQIPTPYHNKQAHPPERTGTNTAV